MAQRVLHARQFAPAALVGGIAKIQQELNVSPHFPEDVEKAAAAAAGNQPVQAVDLTEIPFVTIDPPTAMDLDQAMHLSRVDDGYLVRYAIADLATFIDPGGPIDVEAHRRGETLYGADAKVPLHPTALSEGAASLLPDQTRPALVWSIALDASGNQRSAKLERALVRSRAKFDYESIQRSLDDGTADELTRMLKEIGELRVALERERGGVNLPMPEQEITADGEQWSLEFRSVMPVENWNAQISLLTGFAAAQMMIEAKVGILRTMPPPEPRAVDRLRRTARGLKIDWPADVDYPEFIGNLDSSIPAHAAMLVASTSLLRGAGYAAFDGELPKVTTQAALASAYAHVTAPLRRLADRYALEVCVALSAGQPVPEWVRRALPELPDTMRESGRRAGAYENAVVDLVEAHLLASRVGERFSATVTEVEHDDSKVGVVVIQEPAIEARVDSDAALPLGEQIEVKLVQADPGARQVRFRQVS